MVERISVGDSIHQQQQKETRDKRREQGNSVSRHSNSKQIKVWVHFMSGQIALDSQSIPISSQSHILMTQSTTKRGIGAWSKKGKLNRKQTGKLYIYFLFIYINKILKES